jgi:magnesium and cobalt transporter
MKQFPRSASKAAAAVTAALLLAAVARAGESLSDADLSQPMVSQNSMIAHLALGIAALLLNFGFTVSQTSLAAIGPGALKELEEAERTPSYLPRLGQLEQRLSLASLLCLLTGSFALSRLGSLTMPISPAVGAVAGVIVALLLHLIVVEVFARSLALLRPVVILRWVVPPMRLLSAPLLPFLLVMEAARGIRTTVGHPLQLSDMHLRLLPSLKGVERVLDEDAFEMIDSVRDFAELKAEDVMTPRTEVKGIPLGLPSDEVYERLRESEFSRLVVYDGSLDQVVGTLLAKEVLLRKPRDPFSLLRPPIMAPEKLRLPELLQLIRTNRSHLILIVDEYGGLAGIVTLHDLFEHIIGHIEDVDDAEELWIDRLADGSYRLSGRVEIWELNEELGLNLDEEKARTVGGLVFNTLGRSPKPGDEVDVDGLLFRVEVVDENRVQVITMVPRQNTPQQEEANG